MSGKNPFSRFQHTPAIAQPAFLNSWLVWLAAAAVTLVPFFLPIAQDLRRHPIIGPLGSQLHVILLGGATFLIYWRGPLRGRIWLAALVAALGGGLIEIGQPFFGRGAYVQDWFLDLVGIGLVVGFVLWRGHANPRGKWLMILLLISIPAQLWRVPFTTLGRYEARQMFPVIADFDGEYDQWLWKGSLKGEIAYVFADSTRGQVLQITSGPPSRWPGAIMARFPERWEGYSQLAFEARVKEAAGDSLRFGVRIDDFEGHNDRKWASMGFWGTREWNTFRMPVAQRKMLFGERILDLSDVESIIIFASQPKDSFVLEIDNIRLE